MWWADSRRRAHRLKPHPRAIFSHPAALCWPLARSLASLQWAGRSQIVDGGWLWTHRRRSHLRARLRTVYGPSQTTYNGAHRPRTFARLLPLHGPCAHAHASRSWTDLRWRQPADASTSTTTAGASPRRSATRRPLLPMRPIGGSMRRVHVRCGCTSTSGYRVHVCPVTYNTRIRVLERPREFYEAPAHEDRGLSRKFRAKSEVRPKTVRKGSGCARTASTPIRLKMGVGSCGGD